MGWVGTPEEDNFPEPERIDPFPFTREGRALQRMEHELRLEQARLNVDRLQARKRELEHDLKALRGTRQS
jgi:hypothetical protein